MTIDPAAVERAEERRRIIDEAPRRLDHLSAADRALLASRFAAADAYARSIVRTDALPISTP